MNRKFSPTYEIHSWIVTKNHLCLVFELLKKRFKKINSCNISVTFGDQKEEFFSFDRFDKFINKEIINLNKNVSHIRFFALEINKNEKQLATLQINFDHPKAKLEIEAEGLKKKDWVYGLLNDFRELFESFKPKIELINKLKSRFPNKFKNGLDIIFFDYNNLIEVDKVEKTYDKLKPWYKKPEIIIEILGLIFAFISIPLISKRIDNFYTENSSSIVTNKQPLTASSSASIYGVTAKEIVDTINSYPPLQQMNVANNYNNLNVTWRVSLNGGFESNGKYTLLMRYDGGDPWVWCDIMLDEYPELKIVNKNQKFTVMGKIKSIRGYDINLNTCKIAFDK
ncbi:hypothetical protein HZB69_01225 [Candidatus Amesbacteria bacterium]|nr:hypothetical protein [Candidatus Amesbacteria bacterium]